MMQGFFRANGGCGYVKKPEFLLSADGACHEVFNSMALPVKTILKVHKLHHFIYSKKNDAIFLLIRLKKNNT